MVGNSESTQLTQKLPEDWTIEEILQELDEEYDGRLREEALRAAQAHAEEITPHLIELIRQATESARQGNPPRGDGHFYALFLLTEFRAKEALPAVLEAVSLPGEIPFELFGDCITDHLDRVLAVLVDDSLDVLDSLIANRQVNAFVRWSAASTWRVLVRDEIVTCDHAVERLRYHLRNAIASKDELTGMLVCELMHYVAEEAKDDIQEAFRLDLVDLSLITEECVAKDYSGKGRTRQNAIANCPPGGIADTVTELSSWAAFRDEQFGDDGEDVEGKLWSHAAPYDHRAHRIDADDDYEFPQPIRSAEAKIGRNEPCPCGSGKKFKKCCNR